MHPFDDPLFPSPAARARVRVHDDALGFARTAA